MKRGKFFILFSLLVVSLFFSNFGFVSAVDFLGINPGQAVADGLRNVEEIISPILQVTIGGYDTGEFFWIKFLLLILMFVVVKAGVKATPRIGENNAVANIVALVISLFAVRFINQTDLIEGILLPYGVLGVALTTLLPFIIFFFFVEKTTTNPGARKALWFVFVGIMFLLWINRADQLNDVSNMIYWGVIGLGILLFFFDKHVQIYFGTRVSHAGTVHAINLHLSRLHHDYRIALDDTTDSGKDARKQILKQIKELEKEKHKYE